MKRPKRPGDFAQVAKLVVDIATGSATEVIPSPQTERARAGQLGGLKGGKARAEKLSSAKRRAIAKRAARARWRKGRD